MEPQIGFCTNPEGARIAYATLGQGPAMVFPPGYSSVITFYNTFPEIRQLYDSFARYHTVVIYDMVGAGLSDRNRTVFTLESELRDLETVVGHLKLDRIILNGHSTGGMIAIAYAAKYPERTTHLVLYGTCANRRDLSEEFKAAVVSLIRQPDNWAGRRTVISLCASQAQIDMLELIAAMAKDTATPEVLAHLVDMPYGLDVAHLCPLVKAPTLVMHRKGDTLVDFKVGVELASLIPHARFVPLEGDIHFNFLGDVESFKRNIFEFLGDPITDDKATKAVQPMVKQSCHDVFISFAFPDKQAAGKIYAYFKSNGIDPFWCEELSAGEDYPQLLGEAIRNSKAFLLVVSNASDNSASVRKETTIAHNNNKPIIPVRMEDILPKNLEYLVASSLFFDAFPQPLEQYLPRLTSDIKKIIGSKTEKHEKTKK